MLKNSGSHRRDNPQSIQRKRRIFTNNSKPTGMAKKPSKKKLLELIREHCGIVTDIAESVNASRQTVYKWIANDPQLKQAIEDGRDQLIDLAKSGLKQNIIDGKEKSIIYVLGTLGRKEGFGNVIQVQNRDRLDEQLDGMSDEEILEAMTDSRRRMKKAVKE